jgi:hypothetical protein
VIHNGNASDLIKGSDGRTYVIEVQMDDINTHAFTLVGSIAYDYNSSVGVIEHGQDDFNISIVLSSEKFIQIDNPYSNYVSSGTVDNEEMFFGRSEFINGIIDLLIGNPDRPLRRKSIVLFGQKRTGKTSILYHLKNKIMERSKNSIIIDVGDISRHKAENLEKQFYRNIFSCLSSEIKQNHPELMDVMKENNITIPNKNDIRDSNTGRLIFNEFFESFSVLLEDSRSGRKYNIILMVDEFTQIYIWIKKNKIDNDFMKFWKGAINDFGIVGIIVGQDYMQQFIDAFPNPFGAIEKMPVTYLPEAEAKRMIQHPPVKNTFAVFDGTAGERAVRKILDITACSAFYIMIFINKC